MKKLCWCWGCGKLLESEIEKIEKQMVIKGIVDIDERKWGKNILGYEIKSPSDMREHISNDDMVMITTNNVLAVLPYIIDEGIDKNSIKYWDSKNSYYIDIKEALCYKNYSLDGEEMYLRCKYYGKKDGIYVDVGCHHPFRFSNTQWAYEIGWKGINIDANANAMKLFKVYRDKDINITCGVSDVEGEQNYYTFEDGAVNSFIKERERTEQEPKGQYSVKLRRLDAIFKEYNVLHVDFIDIDVEGMEENVIKSINFNEVTIDTILVEQIPLKEGNYSVEDIFNTEVYRVLKENGYIFTNKYNRTVIYELAK